MTVHAWRIVKARHAATAFSGDGAKLHEGRWNSAGQNMVYTAGTTSLAMLEMLVHLQRETLLNRYALFEVQFDAEFMSAIDVKTLPKNWRASPPPESVQRMGDLWLAESRSAVLRVPSVIVPNESNYMLNPAHPRFSEIELSQPLGFEFDVRLLARTQ